jgi:hypothetical protein
MAKKYTVARDGSGTLADDTPVDGSNAPEGEDLASVVGALVVLANDVNATFNNIPSRQDVRFNASVRQALLNAGNDLDYVLRLMEEIRRDQNIIRLRRELEAETKNLLTHDESTRPGALDKPGLFPSPHVTLTEQQQA